MRRLSTLMLLWPIGLGAQSAADHYAAGRAAMSAKPDDAVKEFEKAVSLDDKNAEYHLWLGNALGTVAQKASVLRQPFLAKRVKSEFERTVQLDPSSVDGRHGLMQFFLEAPGIMGGSVDKAREQAVEIGKVNPMRGHLARAEIAAHDKDGTAREREYRAAVSESPDSVVAYATLVAYLLNAKRTDDACAVVDNLIARRPTDPLALWQMGRLAAVTGTRLDRGEQALRAVLASPGVGTDPRLPVPANVHYRLGDILARRGAKDEARKEYERAIELNPQFDAARKALKAL
ncbi:MAG: tetratricopeptide repeat protein [Gemmatimonadales bacterium]